MKLEEALNRLEELARAAGQDNIFTVEHIDEGHEIRSTVKCGDAIVCDIWESPMTGDHIAANSPAATLRLIEALRTCMEQRHVLAVSRELNDKMFDAAKHREICDAELARILETEKPTTGRGT